MTLAPQLAYMLKCLHGFGLKSRPMQYKCPSGDILLHSTKLKSRFVTSPFKF